MDINKAKEEIENILGEAERDYDYGGSEDEDGGLVPGDVDFEDVKQKIFNIIEELNNQKEKGGLKMLNLKQKNVILGLLKEKKRDLEKNIEVFGINPVSNERVEEWREEIKEIDEIIEVI